MAESLQNTVSPNSSNRLEPPLHSALRKSCLLLSPFLVLAACPSEPPKPARPPPQVTVTKAIERDLPIYVEAIGQTRGSREVQIQPRVSGFLQSQDYKDGALVRAGELLYTIDARPYVATLAQANGHLPHAEAQLQQAKNDLPRYP